MLANPTTAPSTAPAPPTGARAASSSPATEPEQATRRLATRRPDALGGLLARAVAERGRAAAGYVPHRYCRKDPPPNLAVIEDLATCEQLLALCEVALKQQRARAERLLTGGDVSDYRYFFAKVYSFVTENEIKFVKAAAYFYPSYVLRSVLYFEKIYEDNFKAWDDMKRGRGMPEEHWRIAFERGEKAQRHAEVRRIKVMQDTPEAQAIAALSDAAQDAIGATVTLTEAMKAHIRFDLPRAEAWVFNTYYASMPGVARGDFAADFMSMSGVFDNAARAMVPDMSQKLGLPLTAMPQQAQDSSMRYLFDADMATERTDTWGRAVGIGERAGTGPYATSASGALAGDITKGGPHTGGLDQLPGVSRPGMGPSPELLAHPGAFDLSADAQARATVNRLGPAGLMKLAIVPRVQLIRSLLRGSTTNDDEQAILTILNAAKAAGELAVTVDAADAWDLLFALDGDEGKQLRSMLRSGYYGATAQQTALRLIRRCLDGESAEWEEEMIADILEARADLRALVALIGREYGVPAGLAGKPDGALRAGINKLEWQLDGDDETRMRAALRARGLPDSSGYTLNP